MDEIIEDGSFEIRGMKGHYDMWNGVSIAPVVSSLISK